MFVSAVIVVVVKIPVVTVVVHIVGSAVVRPILVVSVKIVIRSVPAVVFIYTVSPARVFGSPSGVGVVYLSAVFIVSANRRTAASAAVSCILGLGSVSLRSGSSAS